MASISIHAAEESSQESVDRSQKEGGWEKGSSQQSAVSNQEESGSQFAVRDSPKAGRRKAAKSGGQERQEWMRVHVLTPEEIRAGWERIRERVQQRLEQIQPRIGPSGDRAHTIGPSGDRGIGSLNCGSAELRKCGIERINTEDAAERIGTAEEKRIESSGHRAIESSEGVPSAAEAGAPLQVNGTPEGVPLQSTVAQETKPRRRRRVKACEYLRLDGTVCGAQVEGDGFCAPHLRWWTMVEESTGMQCPEDRESLQLMLQETMAQVIGGEMSYSKAEMILKISRMMERTISRRRPPGR